jgi:hypothetical protein
LKAVDQALGRLRHFGIHVVRDMRKLGK